MFKDVRSRADAEKRLALLIADRERGKLNLSSRKTIPTLTEYCKKYVSFLKEDSRENTLRARQRAITALCRFLGDYRLDKLTVFLLEKYRIERQKLDGVKPISINQDIAALKCILNRAIKEGISNSNPCNEIKPLKEEKIKDRILTDYEINLILAKLQGKDRVMILTSLFTGMRLNEVLSLKLSDISFGNRLITFVQSKTNKLITVPLSSFLAKEL